MNLQSDFLDMIYVFNNIEEFSMYYFGYHTTLAYVMDKMYGTSDYEPTLQKWKKLAEFGDFSALAMSVMESAAKAIEADHNATDKQKKYTREWLEIEKINYEYDPDDVSNYAIVDTALAPDWFQTLFDEYLKVEEAEKKRAIMRCCVTEEKMAKDDAREVYQNIADDIPLLNEFYFYAKNHRLKEYKPVSICGQSVKRIIERLECSPVSAFQYMTLMITSPFNTLTTIRERTKNSGNEDNEKLHDDISKLWQLFWQIEDFDMLLKDENAVLEYVMDNLYKTDKYDTKLAEWKKMAKRKDFNSLAWSIVEMEKEIVESDGALTKYDRNYFGRRYEEARQAHERGELRHFACLKEHVAPDWTYRSYSYRLLVANTLAKDAILRAYREEIGASYAQADMFCKKIRNTQQLKDLENEIFYYVRNGKLRDWNKVRIQGQTVDDIIKEHDASPMSAYIIMADRVC